MFAATRPKMSVNHAACSGVIVMWVPAPRFELGVGGCGVDGCGTGTADGVVSVMIGTRIVARSR
ncbi:hypothetical protein L3i23_08040 [Herbiconiux sp. L3-i23]|nr:hypothetical protein L3i23_08040 [Herbiconiux sp. L3-i23]